MSALKLPKVIAWFQEIGKEDLIEVGGKGSNLGELTKHQIPVPPGFVVTAPTYFYFLETTQLRPEIVSLINILNLEDSRQLQSVAYQIKNLISQAPMPPEIAQEIEQAYKKLGKGLVAVRSSATAEDLPDASFAGQQRTFLNVQGEKEVVRATQDCWASLFEPRAIYYRQEKGFDHFQVGIAVPVQRMVQSDASGVILTVEPITSDRSKIVVEAILGLGEAIVSGEVTPDMFIVNKADFRIIEKKIGRQEWQLVKSPVRSLGRMESNIKVTIPPAAQSRQKLSDKDILTLARLGKKIEDLYKFPQDIEWAKENSNFYIVQSRPITTLTASVKAKEAEQVVLGEGVACLITGAAASPGIGAGPVRILLSPDEMDKVLHGDVLVAKMTTPDFVPAMKRASAIVTNEGGRTCHAAIVSRELGIPCVVGTKNATETLHEDQVITVDGKGGKVYEGRLVMVTPASDSTPVSCPVEVKTKTKVYVNLAEPELAEKVAALGPDGVGLLRAEFIIARIGEHPRYMLAQKRGDEFVERLAAGITTFARAFEPRPVVYRTTDFKTNEYRELRGGKEFEGEEANPMLGYRGCSRYIRELETFQLELEAIKRVRQYYRNLWIMLPFVRTVKELSKTKTILEAVGLRQSPDLKLWMMVEVPSNIILLDKFLDVGIDGISIGSNDLTQLILGIDRDNARLADDFDERNEAVMTALESAITTCKRRGVTASICGQAPSVYPELTEKLVEWGITSVSVSPDMIHQTRQIVAAAEAKIGSREKFASSPVAPDYRA
ncbi:MAG: phosphoenolpyruvate synthase [Dehalococcoidia bacterium]|nr:phosphoenolpyruvate synthase [Dehalococcoidia bacterium]